jgi:chromosome segregation ATPase
MSEEVAASNSAASTGLAGGVFPSTAAADDDVAMEELGVILEHPTLRAPGYVSLNEAMGTARWALTQAQNVLRRESGGIVDERWRLLVWAFMLKERTMAERARVEARQQHLDVWDELLNRLQTAINNCDHDS